MAKAKKINHLDSDFEITEDGGAWIITDKVNYTDGYRAIYENDTVDTTVTIEGRIGGSYSGVYSTGTKFDLTVAKGARVTGSNWAAVTSNGSEFTLTNDGRIEGAGTIGVRLHGSYGHVINNGRITAGSDTAGIYVTGTYCGIENKKDGIISAGFGVWFADDGENAINFLANHGKIVSTGDEGQAIVGSNCSDTIVNRGKIVGSVFLNGDDDRFDIRGGTVSDKNTRGGDGRDTLITDDASYRLIEAAGGGLGDSVVSSVSYKLDSASEIEFLTLSGSRNIKATGSANDEYLYGNSGDNRMLGLGGSDTFEGRKGNDRMTGGTGADSFIIRTDDGHDVVTDFEHGIDKLYLGSWHGLTSFEGALEHASFKGGDMTISSGKDQILLLEVAKGELDAGDFNFSIV